VVALKPERCGKESVVGHAGVQPVENGAHIDLASVGLNSDGVRAKGAHEAISPRAAPSAWARAEA
jgi:hypothetical protein